MLHQSRIMPSPCSFSRKKLRIQKHLGFLLQIIDSWNVSLFHFPKLKLTFYSSLPTLWGHQDAYFWGSLWSPLKNWKNVLCCWKAYSLGLIPTKRKEAKHSFLNSFKGKAVFCLHGIPSIATGSFNNCLRYNRGIYCWKKTNPRAGLNDTYHPTLEKVLVYTCISHPSRVPLYIVS